MKLGWRGVLGFALSALLLWWTLRGVSVAEVREQLRTANIALLALSAAVATCIFPLRAIRWRVILEPVAPGLPFGPLWRSTAIGMMVNNVVPARAGELVRVFALTRETDRVGFVAGFASLAVDRVFDAVVLITMLVAAMLAPAFPGDTVILGQPASHYAVVLGVAALGILAVLYAIVFAPELIERLYMAVARRLSPALAERGRRLLLSFITGLGALRSPTRFARVFLWTLLHWLVSALSFWIAFRAVGIQAPFSAAVFLQSLIAIGVAIPSSPGFFGVFEASAKVGLAAYGITGPQVITWALGYHILSFLPITIIGAYYFSRLGLHFRDMRGGGSDGESGPPSRPASRRSDDRRPPAVVGPERRAAGGR
jgi:uncharacterized protein (TIRG00374 family)